MNSTADKTSDPACRTIRILGSTVHLIDSQFLITTLERWIEQPAHRPRQIVVSGFHGLWEAHRDLSFRNAVQSADLWIPDGIAPVWIARLKGHKAVARMPGAELMQLFFTLANTRGYSSYFYGDTPEVLRSLQSRLNHEFPKHEIAGTFSPPFRDLTAQENEQILDQINAARPDVLWVGLGLPKQERWIAQHRNRLQIPVIIGVGAAFGFLSGKVKRCPAWLGKAGLEWAYRLVSEPKKLWRRDFLDAPRFLFAVALELAGGRKQDGLDR